MKIKLRQYNWYLFKISFLFFIFYIPPILEAMGESIRTGRITNVWQQKIVKQMEVQYDALDPVVKTIIMNRWRVLPTDQALLNTPGHAFLSDEQKGRKEIGKGRMIHAYALYNIVDKVAGNFLLSQGKFLFSDGLLDELIGYIYHRNITGVSKPRFFSMSSRCLYVTLLDKAFDITTTQELYEYNWEKRYIVEASSKERLAIRNMIKKKMKKEIRDPFLLLKKEYEKMNALVDALFLEFSCVPTINAFFATYFYTRTLNKLVSFLQLSQHSQALNLSHYFPAHAFLNECRGNLLSEEVRQAVCIILENFEEEIDNKKKTQLQLSPRHKHLYILTACSKDSNCYLSVLPRELFSMMFDYLDLFSDCYKQLNGSAITMDAVPDMIKSALETKENELSEIN